MIDMDFNGYLIFMLVVMGVVLSAVVLWGILYLIYVLVLVRPAKRGEVDRELLCDYAHRGLHGNGIPENSLEAFELACQKGFGIELDVQLSRDGTVMVFHDYTLNRMTGIDKKLCELVASELTKISLAETEQKIPTFEQVLALVDGRVPRLIELKGENFDTSLCERVAAQLSQYSGTYCIESFNPLLIKDMRKHLPNSFMGLLYTDVCKEKKKNSVLNILLSTMTFNFLAKPNFIAFNKIYRNSLPVKLTTRLYGAPKFVWTVNKRSELDTAHKNGESPIFENIFE